MTVLGVESTARCDELVLVVSRMQTKMRSDFRGRSEMIGKELSCLTMQTAVHLDA